MKYRVAIWLACLFAAVSLTTPASAFDAGRTKTDAGIVLSAAGAQAIQLNFVAELKDGIPDLVSSDVVVGWQTVGGISPSPFRILIPAGCFAARRGRFHVERFQACSVQMSLNTATGLPIPLLIMSFESRVVPRDDGTYRFDVVTNFIPPDPIQPVLGVLGGSAVLIAIGSEMSTSTPVRTETVSGVEPSPF